MGRLIKNFQFTDGSYAVRLPLGTGATGPSSPQNGQIRFNSISNKVEAYYNSAWREIAQAGRVTVVKDSFTGVLNQQDFTMSVSDPTTYVPGNAAAVMVFNGGVFQNPEVSYTINSTTLHFIVAPNAGTSIIVLHNLNSTIVG